MRLGKVFNSYRTIERINQRDLAKEIGVSAATMSRFESGRGIDSRSFAKIFGWLIEMERK